MHIWGKVKSFPRDREVSFAREHSRDPDTLQRWIEAIDIIIGIIEAQGATGDQIDALVAAASFPAAPPKMSGGLFRLVLAIGRQQPEHQAAVESLLAASATAIRVLNGGRPDDNQTQMIYATLMAGWRPAHADGMSHSHKIRLAELAQGRGIRLRGLTEDDPVVDEPARPPFDPGPVSLDRLRPVSQYRRLLSSSDVGSAQRSMGMDFPEGYSTFFQTFGLGLIGGLVRVYSPQRVVRDNPAWRQRVAEYFFWKEAGTGMSAQRVCQSWCIGDTVQGDELIVHPDDPNRVFVLPRDGEEVHDAGHGLTHALAWTLGSGLLTDPVEFWTFEPWTPRRRRVATGAASQDAIVAAIQGTGLVTESHSSADEDGVFIQQLLPAVGGLASILQDGPTVLRIDGTPNPGPEETLWEALANVGLELGPLESMEAPDDPCGMSIEQVGSATAPSLWDRLGAWFKR